MYKIEEDASKRQLDWVYAKKKMPPWCHRRGESEKKEAEDRKKQKQEFITWTQEKIQAIFHKFINLLTSGMLDDEDMIMMMIIITIISAQCTSI